MADITWDRVVQIDGLGGYRPTSVNDAPSVEVAGRGDLGWAHADEVSAAPSTVAE